jgi:hypothetical protein
LKKVKRREKEGENLREKRELGFEGIKGWEKGKREGLLAKV